MTDKKDTKEIDEKKNVEEPRASENSTQSDDHATTDDAKTKDAKTDDAKVDESKTDDAKAKDATTDDAKAKDATTDDAKAEEGKKKGKNKNKTRKGSDPTTTTGTGATPARIKRAQATGVALALVIVALIIALVVIAAVRNTKSNSPQNVGTFSEEWTDPSATGTSTVQNAFPSSSSTVVDRWNGTIDLGEGESVSWAAASDDSKVAVAVTNGLKRPMTGFRLTFAANSEVTGEYVRQLFRDYLNVELSTSIGDDELVTWTPMCGVTRYLAESDSLATPACTFGGHTITSADMLEKYVPSNVRIAMISEDEEKIELCEYDLDSDISSLNEDLNTLGGWTEDASEIIPEPRGMLYYDFSIGSNLIDFTILGTNAQVKDDYIAMCVEDGWKVEGTDGTMTYLTNSNDTFSATVSWSADSWLAHVYVYTIDEEDEESASASASASVSSSVSASASATE